MMLKIYGNRKPPGKILRKLRKIGHLERVTVHIGKKGLTEEIIKSVKSLLDHRKVVKIRVLKNAYANSGRKEFLENICKKFLENGIAVVEIRGNTILVSKIRF